MAKAVLVFDGIPGTCRECRLWAEDSFGGFYCSGTAFDEESYKKGRVRLDRKPDWCPLRVLPEKREEEMLFCNARGDATGVQMDYRAQGWNDCIDMIEGSGEDG